MNRIFAPALAITALALITSPVFAQDTASNTANTSNTDSGSPTQQFDALNTMTDAMGPMVSEAETRIKLMKAFISANGLNEKAAAAPPATGSSAFTGLDFDKAYQAALSKQKLRAKADTPMSDPAMLKKEVAATKTMVKSQWDRLNKMHVEVANLTSFIQSQNKMDAYQKWATTDAAAQAIKPKPVAAASPRQSSGSITPEQRAQNIKNYQAQQAALRNHWDNYHFTFATSPAVAPIFGTTDTANADYVRNPDYYNGNYYNGYSDPYYDIYGYPGGYGVNNWRGAYHRGNNPRPHVSPEHGHPAIRR